MARIEWPGRFGKKRLTILRAASQRPHRYRVYRTLTMGLTLALLALVPLVLHSLIAVALAGVAIFFVTFNLNLVAGRMFCGWGCPIGQLNRLTDDWAAQRALRDRAKWGAILVGSALLLSLAILLWFTSLSSIWAFLALAAMTASALGFARGFGWSFCRKACPIGLYYSVVQTKRPIGIQIDRSRCLDEGACVRACPVDLDARELLAPKHGIGGLAVDGLSENSHCLRCGACVEACEIATSKIGDVALAFGKAPLVSPKPAPLPIVIAPLPIEVAPLPMLREEPARPVSRWITASIVVGAAVSIGSYAAIAASRAARYAPEETWAHRTEARAETATVPPSTSETIPIRIEGSQFAERSYVAHAKDRLELSNGDGVLHTAHVSRGQRSLINAPLAPGMKPRRLPVPPPGEYRISCDIHPGEEAELLVLRERSPVR